MRRSPLIIPSSQADQWVDGASFFNISLVEDGALGSPRLFQILESDNKTVVWEERLAHNSCLKVDSVTNATYKHAVPPRAKGEPDDKRWSIVCRNLASSIRKDPTNVKSAKYKVTSPAKLAEWKFPKDFDFPWAIDSPWVITWKDGSTEHLVDSINIRECRFERSRLKNEAYDARSLDLLDTMFEWAEREENKVALPESSKRDHRHKVERAGRIYGAKKSRSLDELRVVFAWDESKGGSAKLSTQQKTKHERDLDEAATGDAAAAAMEESDGEGE